VRTREIGDLQARRYFLAPHSGIIPDDQLKALVAYLKTLK